MKAIILAAGYGSRMYPMAQDMPKCLLTINKETLLARQLRILRSCGVEDITVVTGFHRERIVELYGEEVSIRYNPHYEITGNIFSLWTVRNLLTDDVIIANADTVFIKGLIEALLSSSSIYCLAVDTRKPDAEAQKIKTANNAIIKIGKLIPAEEAYGEVIGIARIKKKGVETFRESMFECIKRDSNSYWPTIFQNIAEKGYQVGLISVTSPWMEIDTKEDYEEAKKKFEGGVAY